MKKLKVLFGLTLCTFVATFIATSCSGVDVKHSYKEEIELKLDEMNKTLNNIKDIKGLEELNNQLKSQLQELNNSTKNETNFDFEMLAKINKIKDEQFRKITHAITNMSNNTSTSTPGVVKNDKELEELTNKLKSEHKKEIDELNAKLNEAKELSSKFSLPRNDLSAKKALKTMFDFIEIEFQNAWKEQQPEKFKQNATFWTSMIEGLSKTKDAIKDELEDHTNLNYYERLVMHYIGHIAVLKDYLEGDNRIKLNHPKEKFMDALFDWRLKDIDLAISEVTKQDTKNNPKKDEQLKTLNQLKKDYLVIKNETVDFGHQVIKFKFAEDNLIYKLLLDTNKFHTFRLEYKIPVSSSEFPVYMQINDPKLLNELETKATEIHTLYANFYKNKAKDFLTSVYFSKKLFEFKDNVALMKRIKFAGAANSKKELLYYFEKAKNDLNTLYTVDFEKLTKEYKAKNEVLLKSINDFYSKNVLSKREDEKNYEIFWDWSRSELRNINKIRENDFVSTFNKHIALKKLEIQNNTIFDYFNYWNTLKEKIDEDPLKSILAKDKDLEVYDKSIKNEDSSIKEYEENIKFLNENLKKIFIAKPSDLNETTVKKYFDDKLKVAKDVQNLFKVEQGKDKKFEFFSDALKLKISNSIDVYANELQKILTKQKQKI
ncbi:hypothetical protein [Mycoplasmopsis alligatoris]|uniref:Lipoprotein n=1 Tax=Mycoplasmopsis alligatoris A21JP2 TaxID=747682 RepID=D4XV22_9BACT|nr:hypothetical protein [Mycoplasmopsis alligatoris]EFF41804.1 hypothetical protein MALL_0181 [Mycoplasmopsis alligatoris A21JP2]